MSQQEALLKEWKAELLENALQQLKAVDASRFDAIRQARRSDIFHAMLDLPNRARRAISPPDFAKEIEATEIFKSLARQSEADGFFICIQNLPVNSARRAIEYWDDEEDQMGYYHHNSEYLLLSISRSPIKKPRLVCDSEAYKKCSGERQPVVYFSEIAPKEKTAPQKVETVAPLPLAQVKTQSASPNPFHRFFADIFKLMANKPAIQPPAFIASDIEKQNTSRRWEDTMANVTTYRFILAQHVEAGKYRLFTVTMESESAGFFGDRSRQANSHDEIGIFNAADTLQRITNYNGDLSAELSKEGKSKILTAGTSEWTSFIRSELKQDVYGHLVTASTAAPLLGVATLEKRKTKAKAHTLQPL